MKACSKCKEEKPLTEFHKDKQKRGGVYPSCKTCVNSRIQRFMARPENREKKRAYDRSPEKRAEKQRRRKSQKGLAAESEYRARLHTKFGVNKSSSCNSRAKKAGVNENIGAGDMFNLFASHGFSCYYCGIQSVESDVMTVDHIVPLSAGGGNTIQNCVPACARCNAIKKNRTEQEFLVSLNQGASE